MAQNYFIWKTNRVISKVCDVLLKFSFFLPLDFGWQCKIYQNYLAFLKRCLTKRLWLVTIKFKYKQDKTIFAFTSSDNTLQYLNLQINYCQLQFYFLGTKITNGLERKSKIVTCSYTTYPPDLWDNVTDVKHRVSVTQTHFWKYRQYHVRLFFICFFSPVYAFVKQTPVLSSLPQIVPFRK